MVAPRAVAQPSVHHHPSAGLGIVPRNRHIESMNRLSNRGPLAARIRSLQQQDLPVHAVREQCDTRSAKPLAEYWMFLRELARAPLRTAALAPSSEALASLMVSEIDPQAGLVVELGPGTGRITEALLARGVPQEQLIVVEANPRFARLLRRRFPRALVRGDKAEWLASDPLPGAAEVSAVISGLPLPALGPFAQARILRDWYATLPRVQGFYQFTYAPVSPVAPVRLSAWGLESERLGSVMLNMPPATVYRFRRHRAAEHRWR